MLTQIILAFALISIVSSNDLELGPKEGGRKILDELRKASPLLWRRENAVYIRTTDEEVIYRIVVTDLRDNKDGIARVVEGGVGENEALIELSSPGVLKGYEFHVQVYSTPSPNAKPQADVAAVKEVTNNQAQNAAEVNRLTGSEGRQKRSWQGSQSRYAQNSGEDYGSFSGEGDSEESVGSLPVKPVQKVTPKVENAEKPKIEPQVSAVNSPRQIADSVPTQESTVLPGVTGAQTDSGASTPASVANIPLDPSQQPQNSTDVNLTPTLDARNQNPSLPGGIPLPTDPQAPTAASLDPSSLNATQSSPLPPTQ